MHRAQVLSPGTATMGDIVDTKDYDEAMIILNVGNANSVSTLGAYLYESAQKTTASMVRVTGAAFTLVNSAATAQRVAVGNIKTKNYKRFLQLRLEAGGAAGAPTICASATAVLGKSDKDPGDDAQTLAFDLGD
jgi:hypothetical protein